MQCTVSYKGNLGPVIKWRQNDEAVIRDEVKNVKVSNSTVTSTLRLLWRNDINYTCMVYFSENITSDHNATKTTISTCTWTSDTHKCRTYLLLLSAYTPVNPANFCSTNVHVDPCIVIRISHGHRSSTKTSPLRISIIAAVN